MPRQRRLTKIYAEFVRETDDLLMAFTCGKPIDRSFAAKWPFVAINTAEGCIIRLYDSWNRFCREVVMDSASELPVTATGAVVTRAIGIQRRSQVIGVLSSKLPKKLPYGEPRWADAGECLNAAKTLRITNYATVSAAIGATPSPAEHIRVTRNFIAHRNQRTATQLRKVAVAYGFRGTHVEPYVRHVIAPGITVFEKWISELRLLAEGAVQ
jgi:hypothetical protein